MTSTRIERDFYFHAALHFEDRFYINVYDFTLSFIVETDSMREQNIAMERVMYFIGTVLKNSIFVHATDNRAIEKYQAAGIKICEVPDEPYDQVIAMVLLQKLNSIMENRMKITDLIITSTMSDGVRYSIVSEVSENLLSGNFWWNKADISLCNIGNNYNERDNVVSLFQEDEWSELDLTWKEKNTK